MVGHWISFGIIFFIIPIIVAFAKIQLKEYVKVEITPEMNKAANIRLAKYVLFYWFCDLFYMACFIDNIVCKFVFGGLILFIVFMNLAGVFTLPKEKTGFEKWGILQDFVVGIGLTIYLIYIIPNKELQSIVVPIVAAVYGGLLTLTGVSWTIKHNANEKHKTELAQAKPVVFLSGSYGFYPDINKMENKMMLSNNEWGTLNKYDNNGTGYQLGGFIVYNSDYSHCVLRGFAVNEDTHYFDMGQVFKKDYSLCIRNDFVFCYEQTIERVYLIFEDMLGNYYWLDTNFKVHEPNGFYSTKSIEIKSGIEFILKDKKEA